MSSTRNGFSRFVKSATVPAARYKTILECQKGNIDDVSIIPARLGSRGFGSIVIRFKMPVASQGLCPKK